jgi:hypothetical protein
VLLFAAALDAAGMNLEDFRGLSPADAVSLLKAEFLDGKHVGHAGAVCSALAAAIRT